MLQHMRLVALLQCLWKPEADNVDCQRDSLLKLVPSDEQTRQRKSSAPPNLLQRVKGMVHTHARTHARTQQFQQAAHTSVDTLHSSNNSMMMTPVLSLPCVQCITTGKFSSTMRIRNAMATLDLPYKTPHQYVRCDSCQLTDVCKIRNTRLCKLMRCQAMAATSDMVQGVYTDEQKVCKAMSCT